RTSPYRFYQFWLNIDDADVVSYLKYFTWLTRLEIIELEHAVDEHPERREAQRKLAREMTLMVHGETALANAEQASSVLFGGDLDGLSAADIEDIFADVPSNSVARTALGGDGIPVVDLLVNSDLATGKGDARRSIDGGGIYLNNQRVTDPAQTATTADAIDGQFIILRKGRKRYHLVQVMD
ncbi:MAG: tyrosine--tRNA ligase, partial [Candidatus Promineifilaceae bacterium]